MSEQKKTKTERINEKLQNAKNKKLTIKFEYIVPEEVLKYMAECDNPGELIWDYFVEMDWNVNMRRGLNGKAIKISNASKNLKVAGGSRNIMDDIVYEEMQAEEEVARRDEDFKLKNTPEYKQYKKLKKKFGNIRE